MTVDRRPLFSFSAPNPFFFLPFPVLPAPRWKFAPLASILFFLPSTLPFLFFSSIKRKQSDLTTSPFHFFRGLFVLTPLFLSSSVHDLDKAGPPSPFFFVDPLSSSCLFFFFSLSKSRGSGVCFPPPLFSENPAASGIFFFFSWSEVAW